LKFDEIELNEQKFASTIGVEINSLTDECKSLLKQYNLKYRHLDKEEFEEALLCIFQGMQTRLHLKSGRDRKFYWDAGWKSNLDSYKDIKNAENLKPGYFRYEKYVRYDGTYVKPLSSEFVFKFLKILQAQFYVDRLKNIDNVFELGCGSGHNIASLSEFFPNKNFIGLDWSIEAINIVNLLNENIEANISGQIFDFFTPHKNDFEVPPNSAFITTGAFEQMGTDCEKIIQFTLDKKPDIVINLEPIREFYDPNNLSDFVALNYHDERNYLNGYYTKLLSLEKKGALEIEFAKKINFGGHCHDGWSTIIWRPL
tara:strand:- start:13244 stop:14182 length:939 start_codon:yes stop_codon:yes gene_type:complete